MNPEVVSADMLPVEPAGIPAALKALPRWGVWKLVFDRETGKPKKLPFRASDGKPADSTNREDWGPFEDALVRYRRGGYDGLGFAFFPEDGLVGIDRDDCRNAETGVIQPWALRELAALPTYAEVSPSGTGYKQIGRGSLPPEATHTRPGSQTEIYDGHPKRERYFTVTGHVIEGVTSEVQDISSEVLEAHKQMVGFGLLVAFERKGWLWGGGGGSKQLVRCPWAHEHTHGDDEAALFKRKGRAGGFSFKCLHSHCEGRKIADVYLFFGFGSGQGDSRPAIDADGGDLHKKTVEVFKALEDLNEEEPTEPVIYMLGNTFGRITWMTIDEKPATDFLTTDKLKALLATNIRFYKITREGLTDSYPPEAVVRNMLSVAEPPSFPRIRRIVSAPVFGRDGTLLTGPGFHPKAGVYYAPGSGLDNLPSISKAPSDEEVRNAVGLLVDELLFDFPFAGQAERAHAVSLLLLFFARDLISGDLPLHLIDKPEVGTGAGKLADACLIPALGGRQAVITDCNDEDEWRKRITSVLLGGPEVVLLDNITKIDSHQLAALLTTGKWSDRMLGLSRMVELPAEMPWVATGNNPEIGYDIVRRVCSIRLNARMADPTQRTNFKHQLPMWAIENRSALVHAALTIISNWLAKGREAFKGRPVASFEQWSLTMGGILETAGIEGFGSNLAMFRAERNTRANAWIALVEAWLVRFKDEEITSGKLWPLVEELELQGELGLHGESAKDPRVAFGLALRRQRERQFRLLGAKGELRVEVRIETGDVKQGKQKYRLVDVAKLDFKGGGR